VREAAIANAITTIAKIIPVLLFIALVAGAFNFALFQGEAESAIAAAPSPAPALGSLMDQVKSTMLVTLWAFIGIEGASVISARARYRSDVGNATMSGFIICLALYVAVSLLSLGIMTQPELAALKIPFIAARDGTMPKLLGTENAKHSPSVSLWITNGLVQLFLILTFYAQATYYALFTIASAAIVVPYALSGAYALKLALSGEAYRSGERRGRDILVGLVATVYGIWLVYAASPKYLFLCAMLYAAGIAVYVWARRERNISIFTPVETLLASIIETLLAVVLAAAGLLAAYLLWSGSITI
jgi:arginine:ornithine antiporter/lysine permease